ncbi:probable Xaa-Pro aminopeptidase P [Ziziphus jujuba]|uniref:Probable Xaa-Pro aminopeptidase P n=1 Tax=Ziziphus jujuba TaxID=326968 RepID=A0ABM3I7U2_ZIZJJ|nr:probable Xaa-Pro aminopeptidase P [Ziziphus jujuba]
MGTPCVQFFKNKENLRLFFFYTPGACPTVKSGSKGKRHRLILTKTLEWTLNWCILQSMFDRTPVELEGLRKANIRDGVAVVQYLVWLDKQMQEIYGVSGYFLEGDEVTKKKQL